MFNEKASQIAEVAKCSDGLNQLTFSQIRLTIFEEFAFISAQLER